MKHSNHLIGLSTIHMLLSAQFINDLNVNCVQRITETKRLRSDASKKRRKKVRIHFEKFVKSISSRHFRRMFRMPLDCFQLLCQRIESDVGEDKFLSERYIKEVIKKQQSRKRHIYNAHCETSGGYISG